MRPTWESLAPILRGADVRSDATWAVLQAHHEFLLGHVTYVVRGARDVAARLGGIDGASDAAFQTVVEKLHARVGNPPPGLPVSVAADGSHGSATRWFATVVRNLTRDWVKAERRRMRRETEIPEHAPPRSEPEVTLWDDANLRKLQRLLDRPERAGVPEPHVLAYLCLYKPEAVDRAMVDRAAAYVPSSGSRSGRPGLGRSVDEAWAALEAWRDRHETAPRTTAARAELAWILRSEDRGPAETWRGRAPEAARRGAVTVGKWAIRCADALSLPRRS